MIGVELTRRSQRLTLAAAQSLVDAALVHARELGKKVSIAVVDDGGHLLSFGRMEDASASSANIALDKAFTAATTGVSTHEWYRTVTSDEQLRVGAAVGVDRLIVFGGGQTILVDGEVVGGIGSSGGHWTGDTAITGTALASLGLPHAMEV